jgi:hypothetical protein
MHSVHGNLEVPKMGRALLLLFLFLIAVNLTVVHCSKGNITTAKHKRCSACQVFVQELHSQMAKSADTKDTILKQVTTISAAVLCVDPSQCL